MYLRYCKTDTNLNYIRDLLQYMFSYSDNHMIGLYDPYAALGLKYSVPKCCKDMYAVNIGGQEITRFMKGKVIITIIVSGIDIIISATNGLQKLHCLALNDRYDMREYILNNLSKARVEYMFSKSGIYLPMKTSLMLVDKYDSGPISNYFLDYAKNRYALSKKTIKYASYVDGYMNGNYDLALDYIEGNCGLPYWLFYGSNVSINAQMKANELGINIPLYVFRFKDKEATDYVVDKLLNGLDVSSIEYAGRCVTLDECKRLLE